MEERWVEWEGEEEEEEEECEFECEVLDRRRGDRRCDDFVFVFAFRE